MFEKKVPFLRSLISGLSAEEEARLQFLFKEKACADIMYSHLKMEARKAVKSRNAAGLYFKQVQSEWLALDERKHGR